MTARPRVVITRKIPAACEAEAAARFDAVLNRDDTPLTTEQLKDALRTADALLPTVTDKVTAEVLGVEGRRAKIVSNFGVGFNNIDITAAKGLGITVTNTPDVLTDDTADIAMTLLLTVARRTGEGERHVRQQAWTGWRPTHMLGARVSGKTLGLIGFGRIAKAVAQRAHHGFGMRILFADPFPPPPEVAKSLGAEQRATVEDRPMGGACNTRARLGVQRLRYRAPESHVGLQRPARRGRRSRDGRDRYRRCCTGRRRTNGRIGPHRGQRPCPAACTRRWLSPRTSRKLRDRASSSGRPLDSGWSSCGAHCGRPPG